MKFTVNNLKWCIEYVSADSISMMKNRCVTSLEVTLT